MLFRSNPSSVNDRPVGKGNRVVLTGGERLSIGGYVLEAGFDHAAPVFSNPTQVASGADPLGLFGGAPAGSPLFADPFAGVQAGPAAPAVASAPPPAPRCATARSSPRAAACSALLPSPPRWKKP